VSGPIELLSTCTPTRRCATPPGLLLRWQDFSSTLGQNETLVPRRAQVKPRDAVDREFLRSRSRFRGRRRRPAGRQAPARQAIQDRITELRQQFDKNVRDDSTKVAVHASRAGGVPRASGRTSRATTPGRVLLGLDYPTYLPVLELGDVAAARERIYRAKLDEGGETNLKRPRRDGAAAPTSSRRCSASPATPTSSCVAAWPATPPTLSISSTT
jgi:thimet oligopeptidase